MSSVSVPVVDYVAKPAARRRFSWTFWIILGIVGVGLFFMLLVPTMCRSSEVADRIKSSSNLRQLGLAMTMYADAHGHTMPGSWADLAMGEDVTPDLFISASSNDDRSMEKDPTKWGPALLDPKTHTCSYTYAGDGLTEAQAKDERTVLAFEPTDHNSGEGIHLLYGNGSTEWVPVAPDGESQRHYQQFLAANVAHVRPLKWNG